MRKDDLEEFLNVDLGLCIQGRNVGFHLLKLRITREHLNPDQLDDLQPPPELVTGMVIDLVAFCNKAKDMASSKTRRVLHFLGADVSHLSDQQITSRQILYSQYPAFTITVVSSAEENYIYDDLKIFFLFQLFHVSV